MIRLILYTDGAARGNPGPAGAGAILCDSDGKTIAEVCEYLGELTNNQAEYRALIVGLEKALGQGLTSLSIRSDSELMVKQIKGSYKVKNEGIKPLFAEATRLLSKFAHYTINHIPRELNSRADALANKAIENAAL